MTKYDIKLRRRALTKGQIERHKDFRGMVDMKHGESGGRSWVRLALILFATAAIASMIVFGILKVSTPPPAQENVDQEIFKEFKTE